LGFCIARRKIRILKVRKGVVKKHNEYTTFDDDSNADKHEVKYFHY